jgi:hypothetical protein
MSYKFKNADRLKRNRAIEGETGTEIGFPGGDTLWILAATDANPRWLKFGDDYINGLRRLQRANASDERVKTYQAEWFTRIFVFQWDVKGEDDAAVPFSQEACRSYLMETDDVIPAIQRTAFDNQNFRGAKVEVVVGEGKGSSIGGPSTGQTLPTGSDLR